MASLGSRTMSYKVSVIVPWNMARFLPDAIASIPKVHEIIIVAAQSDDGSFDVANELARHRPEIRVLAGSNQGRSSARRDHLPALGVRPHRHVR